MKITAPACLWEGREEREEEKRGKRRGGREEREEEKRGKRRREGRGEERGGEDRRERREGRGEEGRGEERGGGGEDRRERRRKGREEGKGEIIIYVYTMYTHVCTMYDTSHKSTASDDKHGIVTVPSLYSHPTVSLTCQCVWMILLHLFQNSPDSCDRSL